MRINPHIRPRLVEVARATGLAYDGVIHIALRYYAGQRGIDLPGWQQPTQQRRDEQTPRGELRVWSVAPREWWETALPSMQWGEVNTSDGVIREAIRRLYLLGVHNDAEPKTLTPAARALAGERWRAEAFQDTKQDTKAGVAA